MPPPFKKKPTSDIGAPEPVGEKPPKMPKPPVEPTEEDLIHEQGESALDFAAIGEKFGLSPEDAKAFAYDVLEACMKATGGEAHEALEPPEAEEGGEAAEYGR